MAERSELITDHPYQPSEWGDRCGHDVRGWPCGFGIVEHQQGSGVPDAGMTDHDNLRDHLEETMTLGHGFKFDEWRSRLPMGALLSIHDAHHRAEANHPEGFHSHERQIP